MTFSALQPLRSISRPIGPKPMLTKACVAIAERGINITGVAGATCGGSGSVGLITNDEASTSSVLDGGSFSYRQIDLVSAALDDRPGTLAAAARRLADAGVNVEFLLPTGM